MISLIHFQFSFPRGRITMLLFKAFILMTSAGFSKAIVGNFEMIVVEKMEDCTKPGEKTGVVDFSDLKIYVTETTTYLNGTIKILKPLDKPIKAFHVVDKKKKGEWVFAGIQKTINDLCATLKNRMDIIYPYTQKYLDPPTCPFPVRSRILFSAES